MGERAESFTTPGLRGVSLRAVHRGDGSAPLLVLLHGGGANSHWWDHLAPQLAIRFHTVALDFRGHGDSGYPAELEVGGFDRDLEALLEHLRAPDAILVGHSMGAAVALAHAAASGATRAVVAIDVARGASGRARRAMRLALALRRSYRSFDEAVARYRFVPPAPGASEALRRHVAEHSVRREPDGRFGFKFDPRWFGLAPPARAPLSKVRCPVLIVRGEQSALLTAEGAAELAAELPDARVVAIPEAGHNVHLEHPTEVLEAIEEFLG